MQSHYKSLLRHLKRFHILRLILAVFLFSSAWAFINYFDNHTPLTFITSKTLPFASLSLAIQRTIDLISTIELVTTQALRVPFAEQPVCKTQKQCADKLSSAGRMIQNSQGVSPDFICLMGECQAASGLTDYYWRFLIRQHWISSFYVNYVVGTSQEISGFMVPAVADNVYADDMIAVNRKSQWSLRLIGNSLQLNKIPTSSLILRISATMDQQQLQKYCNMTLEELLLFETMGTGTESYYVAPGNYSAFTDPDGQILFALKSLTELSVQNMVPYELYMLPVMVLVLIALLIGWNYVAQQWVRKNFRRLPILNKLYRYELNEIFQGRKPVNSILLEESAISEFYEQVGEIPGKHLNKVVPRMKREPKVERFRFSAMLQNLRRKFQQFSRPIFTQKNKQIINNKFMISSSINQLSEGSCKKIKEVFSKVRELKLTPLFFRYGYYALLLSTHDYDSMVAEDPQALPEPMLMLFRQINRTVKTSDITHIFRLPQRTLRETEEQLQIRMQDNLIQRYLQLFRELDSQGNYARQMGLTKELGYLNENIENLRFLLTSQHSRSLQTPEINE